MSTAKKTIFHTVNNRMYLPLYSPFSLAIFLYEIRLAIDAINVPKPPRFVPTISPAILSVNPDKSNAAGTLLMTWLAIIAV